MKQKTKKIIAREILFFILFISASILFFAGTFGYNWIRQVQIKKIEKDIEYKNIIVDSLIRLNYDLKSVLQDYVATANTSKYNSDWNVINSKFPVLNNIDKELLQEYVATANNPKYGSDWDIINSKFPEFFPVKNSNDSSSKKRTFKINNDIYYIRFNLVESFLKRHPSAIEMKGFILFQDTLNIEFNEISKFISENPDAMPIYEFSRSDSINIHKSNISILKTKKNTYENMILSFDEQLIFVKNLLIGLLILLFGLRYLYYALKWSIKTLKS